MKHKPLVLTCALAGVWGAAPASALAAEPVVVLDSVVVTASGYEQKIKEAPASISVITREQLTRMPVANLNDAVRHLEGVNIVGGDPNDKDISLRGMPGSYTLIMVDGKRQGTREAMNRGTGGVQSFFMPPKEAIERIEVVRGPMSSLYGSDAMGGVINIITRKMPKAWHGSFSAGGTLQKRKDAGNGTEAGFWVGGPLIEDTLSLQLYGNYQERHEDAIFYPSNTTAGASGNRDSDYTAKLNYRPTANQDVEFEAGHQSLRYYSNPGKTLAASDKKSSTTHERDHWAISHSGRWSFGNTRAALYQEEETLKNSTSSSEPRITNTTFDGQLTLPFDRHVVKTGAQAGRQALRGVGKGDNQPGHPANADSINVNTWAVFAEDEFAVTDKLTLTGGARVDHHSVYGSHTTPRLYAVYALTPQWTLRGGVATGFKAPTLRQISPSYCMRTGGGSSKLGTLCGNTELKAEKSTSGEIGVRYDGTDRQSFSVTLFNNDFKDMVTSYDTGKPDKLTPGRSLYIYDNIAKVTIRGLEVGAVQPIGRDWKVTAKYTYLDSKRKESRETTFAGQSLNGQPLDRTPKHNLMVQLDWAASENANLWLRGNAYSKMYWAAFRNGAKGVRERPASHTFDLGGSYAITKSLSVNAAVLNLTDKVLPIDTRTREEGLSGNWMVDEGRRLWATVNYQF
ncbi:TonB-dependent receptor domain-containing protein [Paludibacterium paludis]|uniref:Ligand-gated channel protein n=1 Tax=Paludibacterium paludis TaxID=1225769 RepID=A0A918UBK4_9NEIS|nr:TonB-dependent receptor [Paludibacterium paludis]GGY22711.1 ligand-gated channel protein [Paludibacterium paludis]